jgi:signal transduction histidine kinase
MLSGEHEGLCGVFVALTIADTGCGMSPEVMARVFDPFFTTKPADCGTGLGLSTVRSFAKQFRGAVTIESELGKGTSVTVYLQAGNLDGDFPFRVLATTTRPAPAIIDPAGVADVSR